MTAEQLQKRFLISPVSRAQVGILIGVSESMMSRNLSSKSHPSPKFLRRAAAALNLLEAAHRACEDTRQRFLAKWPQINKRYE